MSEKTKKWLVLAGLIILCVVLVVGIKMRLYNEDTTDHRFEANTEEQNKTEDKELSLAKNPTTVPEPTAGPQPTQAEKPTNAPEPTKDIKPTDVPEPTQTELPTNIPEPTEAVIPTESPKPTEAIVIDTGRINPDDVQELQPKPEKEQTPMPTGTPTLAEGTDLTDPTKKPVYQEDTTVADTEKATDGDLDTEEPKMGDMKDGYVYIIGFGWVPYEGEGQGTYAEDMYENGNKIGIMD